VGGHGGGGAGRVAPTRAAVRVEYLASLQRWARADGYALPGEFVLGVGERTPAL